MDCWTNDGWWRGYVLHVFDDHITVPPRELFTRHARSPLRRPLPALNERLCAFSCPHVPRP